MNNCHVIKSQAAFFSCRLLSRLQDFRQIPCKLKTSEMILIQKLCVSLLINMKLWNNIYVIIECQYFIQALFTCYEMVFAKRGWISSEKKSLHKCFTADQSENLNIITLFSVSRCGHGEESVEIEFDFCLHISVCYWCTHGAYVLT